MNDNYYNSDMLDFDFCKKYIKPRLKNTHKGTYGRVGIVAGSIGMTGSVCIASMSCLRSGTGLVYTVIPYDISDIVCIKLTECVIRPVGEKNTTDFFKFNDITKIMDSINDCDCIVLGPGIGTNCETKKVVQHILLNYNKPVVLDADGLNCISDNVEILNKRLSQTVITPHLKEFERLLSNTNIVFEDRIKTSFKFAKKNNAITLLKGYNTVITNSNGQYFINPTGNPGMATAGSGDVLSGIIASFIGQKIDVFEATCCAAYIHGLAGDLASIDKGEYGLIATDIISQIPYAIKKIL